MVGGRGGEDVAMCMEEAGQHLEPQTALEEEGLERWGKGREREEGSGREKASKTFGRKIISCLVLWSRPKTRKEVQRDYTHR